MQGRGVETGCSLLWERKADLFEHSFKHPGVVGKNVLTLSFNFQSEDFSFFFFQLKFKDSLKNVFFLWLCILLSVRQSSTGQRVKHVIHQNKINNERVFLLESAGEKKCLLPTCLW